MTPTEVDVPETKPAAAAKPGKASDKTEEAKEAKAPKKEYTALPDGFVAPVAFAKLLTERLRTEGLLGEDDDDVRPQVVYGYVKNGSEFPVQDAPEGARSGHMVKVDDALDWCISRRKKSAESKAKKAAEAAAAETEGDSE